MHEEKQLRRLFDRLVELQPAERDEYLREHCPDESLRVRVQRLLAQHEATEDLLDQPAVQRFADLILATGTAVGEFKIVKEIGRGGMGVVYLADDTVLGRKVALKLLSHQFTASERALGRFRQEARAAAQLAHPNIVSVYRYGEVDGTHYIAMELVDGVTLGGWLERLQASQPPAESRGVTGSTSDTVLALPRGKGHMSECASWISQVADALDCAHRAGVIHRDVKPSNILIDQQSQARLADFGIAKLLSEEPITQTGDLAGTFWYMSPEQAAARSVQIDHRSDIFSLGIVLFELLTYQRPFEGSSPQQVLDSLRSCTPVPVRKINPAIPRDLSTICHKALQKNPAERYQTAAHFAADLRCFLSGDPILARPPSIVRRCRHWVTRRPVRNLSIVAASLAVLVSALLGADAARRRAERCPVAVTSTVDGAEVYAQRVNEETLMLGAPLLLGEAPLKGIRLPTGQYRLTVVLSTERFAETDIYLFERGVGTEVDMPLPEPGEDRYKDMVLYDVPKGTFGRAGAKGFERRRTISVPPFWIDKYAVSQGEYKQYLDDTGREWPELWLRCGYHEALADYPVVGVKPAEAAAYARWAKKRLPTVFEWELAGRAPDGRILPSSSSPPTRYPFLTLREYYRAVHRTEIDSFDEYLRRVLTVASDPCPSALGMHHLMGNVREWTSTFRFTPTFAVVLKGAAWTDDLETANLAMHRTLPPNMYSTITGFRCAITVRHDNLTSEN